MKFKYIYISFSVLLGLVTMFSYSSGPARSGLFDRTGSPVSGINGNFCAECHSSGSFDPTVEIQLSDGTGAVTKYVPGNTYTLQVKVVAGTGTPDGYGFQSVILDGNNQSVGTFGSAPNGTGVQTLSNRQYFEHRSRRPDNTFEIEWTAPAAGTGDVSIYAAGIASNANSQQTGDGAAKTSLTLNEDDGASVNTNSPFSFSADLLNNPVENEMVIDLENNVAAKYQFRMMSLNGQVLLSEVENIQAGNQLQRFDVSGLTPGMYLMAIENGLERKMLKVVKN
jgi:hypothetical protein